MKYRVLASAVLALGLSACGGGGGSGSGSAPASSPPPPPPPPPPAANSAPDLAFTVTPNPVDEGQGFLIDARASSDADGDALTFQIVQVSGIDTVAPPAGFVVPAGEGVAGFGVPLVDADSELEFEVSVSDGEEVVTQTVSVTVANIVRAPLSGQWTDLMSTLSVGQEIKSFYLPYVIYDDMAGGRRVAEVSLDPDGHPDLGSGVLVPALEGDLSHKRIVLDDFNLDTRSEFAVLDVESDLLKIYRQPVPDPGYLAFEEVGSFGPGGTGDWCAIYATWVGDDRPLINMNEYPGVLVGTEGGGLVGLLNSGNPRTVFPPPDNYQEISGHFTEARQLSTSGHFCGFDRADISPGDYYRLTGFDDNRMEIVPIDEPVSTNPSIGQAIPIASLGGAHTLVDMRGGIGQSGQEFLAMLFTDGKHDGDHRLVIVQDVGGSVRQDVIQLPNGVPTQLFLRSIDDINTPGVNWAEFDDDIIIVVPGTPYLYVLENLSSNEGGPVTFSGIRYFEVGFGVSAVTTLYKGGVLGPELVVGTSDGIISVYKNIENDAL